MSKGAAGKVGFPAHMETVHKDWLGFTGEGGDTTVTTSLIEVMNTALGVSGNPFDSLSYTDPSTDFDAVETEYAKLETKVDALAHDTDYGSIVDTVVAKLDTAGVLNDIDVSSFVDDSVSQADTVIAAAVKQAVDLVDDQTVLNLVKNFEHRTNYLRDRARRRFSGQMADINAVNSSAFMFGLALVEAQSMQSVSDFHSDVTRQQFGQFVDSHITIYRQQLISYVDVAVRNKVIRDNLLGQQTDRVVGMLYQNVSFTQALSEALGEIKRVRTVAEAEYVGNSADLNKNFSLWDFEVFDIGTRVLGGLGGGSYVPKGASKTSSAIGGALSGAGKGAALGSAVPGLGTGVGAAIGAGLGIGSALF